MSGPSYCFCILIQACPVSTALALQRHPSISCVWFFSIDSNHYWEVLYLFKNCLYLTESPHGFQCNSWGLMAFCVFLKSVLFFAVRKQRHASATKIQALWRGWYIRHLIDINTTKVGQSSNTKLECVQNARLNYYIIIILFMP